jgi:hypothetical protein
VKYCSYYCNVDFGLSEESKRSHPSKTMRGWYYVPEKQCKQIQGFWGLNHNLHFGPWLGKKQHTKTPFFGRRNQHRTIWTTYQKIFYSKFIQTFCLFEMLLLVRRCVVSGTQHYNLWLWKKLSVWLLVQGQETITIWEILFTFIVMVNFLLVSTFSHLEPRNWITSRMSYTTNSSLIRKLLILYK